MLLCAGMASVSVARPSGERRHRTPGIPCTDNRFPIVSVKKNEETLPLRRAASFPVQPDGRSQRGGWAGGEVGGGTTRCVLQPGPTAPAAGYALGTAMGPGLNFGARKRAGRSERGINSHWPQAESILPATGCGGQCVRLCARVGGYSGISRRVSTGILDMYMATPSRPLPATHWALTLVPGAGVAGEGSASSARPTARAEVPGGHNYSTYITSASSTMNFLLSYTLKELKMWFRFSLSNW
mmetsp:Transcript_153539/g.268474  ORF Transcript_153539/g.268474 Transcript_153539/m.268474 type:complete len:241 (+) Transcript_153539:176-898(+)